MGEARGHEHTDTGHNCSLGLDLPACRVATVTWRLVAFRPSDRARGGKRNGRAKITSPVRSAYHSSAYFWADRALRTTQWTVRMRRSSYSVRCCPAVVEVLRAAAHPA